MQSNIMEYIIDDRKLSSYIFHEVHEVALLLGCEK